MEIKKIINLFLFEIKNQLQTKSFWILALLPPLALIAVFWVNSYNTISNKVIILNQTDIPLVVETNKNLNVIKTTSAINLNNKEDIDAVISISRSDGKINCIISQNKLLSQENISYIKKSIRDSYVHFLLSKTYSTIERRSDSEICFTDIYSNVETTYLTSLATIVIIILYIVILQFSSSILRMIGKEKKNKISEVLLTALDERDIILSKLFAGLLVAIIQIIFWLIGALVIAYICDCFIKTTILINISDIWNTFISNVSTSLIINYLIVTLIMFTGGYLLYSSIFAIIGAVSKENTNTQQFSIIATLPLLLTFVFVSKNLNSSSAMIDFLSIFPLSSPIALLAKITYVWSWTDIMASIILLCLSDIILIYITSNLYKFGTVSFKLKNKSTIKKII